LLDPNGEVFPVEKYIYPTEYENLYSLPNIPETAGLEPDLIRETPKSFFRLREKIRDYALENYDFTIIDNPPNMGTFVISSLYTSDLVIVPNEVDSAFSLEGLVKAMHLIKDIQENGNPDLKFLRLLINKVDRRTSISRVAIQHIKNSFKADQFFETTIPINTAFKQAEHFRQTIFRYKSSAPGAKAYRKLAQELLNLLPG
jgi:cellulose biosynthesis protein BcsQ